jgi:hypothetical protein
MELIVTAITQFFCINTGVGREGCVKALLKLNATQY